MRNIIEILKNSVLLPAEGPPYTGKTYPDRKVCYVKNNFTYISCADAESSLEERIKFAPPPFIKKS